MDGHHVSVRLRRQGRFGRGARDPPLARLGPTGNSDEIFARSAASHPICKGVADVAPKSFSLQEFFGATVRVRIVAKSAHEALIDVHSQFSLARTRA